MTLIRKLRFFKTILFLVILFFGSIQIASAQNCSVNAGIPENICENDSYTLNGSSSGLVASGPIWSQIAGPSVIIQNPSDLNSTVIGMTGGNTYTFRLTATCTDTATPVTDDVVLTVLPITIANAGTDVESCPDNSGSIVIAGNTPENSGEVGIWTIVGSNNAGVTINFPNNPSTTLTLNENSAGTSTLRWTITGTATGGVTCESLDEISVTNYGGVDPVDAGPDQNLDNCYTVTQNTNLEGSFGGNGLNGQQGTWSFVSGPSTPTIANPNNNQTGVSNLIEGTYVFRWSVSGSCVSGSDTVNIIVDEATQDITQASIQGSNQVFCDAGITQTTLIGNVAEFTGETVLWEQTGGPTAGVTITNTTSSTSQVTGLSSPNSYTFRYTITNSTTNCDSSDSITVGYNPNPISISASDIIANCDELRVDIPFTTTGGGSNQYRILSGPTDSSFSFPTTFQSFNNSSPLSILFDEEGTYTVQLRRRQGGQVLTACQEATEDINITISRSPSAANAGTDQILGCGITSTSLAGSVVGVGTSIWSQVSGPTTVTIANPYDRITPISGLIEGTYIFRYYIPGGPNCPPAQDDVEVFVSATSNGPSNAGADQTVCFGTPVALEANIAPEGQQGTWIQTSGPDTVTFADANNPTTLVSGIDTASSVYTFEWSIDNPTTSCGGPAIDTVTITTTANQGPSVSNAGPDQCLSSGTTSVNLNASVPDAGETGLWTASPNTGITFADATLFNTVATITTEQSYILTWTISSITPGCQDTSDDLEITVGASAAANAGSDQEGCANSFVMAATSSTGDGLWSQVSGPGGFTIDDETSPTAVFTFTIPGVYVFDWAVNNGSCSSDNDQVEINVGIPPTTATTAGPQTVCNGDSVVLTGNTFNADTENGVWTILSGAPNTPNITDVNDPNTNVTGLVTGTYTFRWSIIGSAICPTSFADVVVDVFSPASAGSDQNLCNATNTLLEATFGSTGTWTQVSGPVVTITQNPVNSNIANAEITPGNTYVFEFTTDYGSCPNQSDQITVVNSGPPSVNPNAGTDQFLCQADLVPTNSTNLSGNAAPVDVDTATWRFASQPSGSVAVIDNPNSNTSTLSNLSEPGIYILEWNFASGNCSDVSDVVRIEVFEAPSTANAGPDQTNACQLSAQLSASVPSVGIGVWSFANPSDDPSGGAVVIDSPNSPNTTLSNITTLGTYTLTWTVTSGTFTNPSNCAPSIDTVDITFTDVPASEANAGPDQELCNVAQTSLNATSVGIGSGTWTQTAGAAATITAPTNPNSLINDLVPGTYEFTWTTNNNSSGCSFTDSVEIIILEQPANANAGVDQSVPQFSTVTLGADPATVGEGIWSQVSGPTTVSFTDENNPTTTLSGTSAGTYEFQWTVSNGICAITSDIVEVRIIGIADLELTKTVTSSSVNIGDTVTFTIAVFNNDANSSANATGVSVEDFIPSGYTFVLGSTSDDGVYNPGNLSLTWNNLSIAEGATINLQFQATVNATGDYVNSAEIIASDQLDSDSTVDNDISTEDDQDTASITLRNVDIELTKTSSATSGNIDDVVNFTIAVFNNDAVETGNASGVQVVDQLPNGFDLVGGSVSNGGNFNFGNNTITWNNLSIANGSTTNLTYQARVNNNRNYTNIAEVTSMDQNDPDSTPNNDDGDQSEDEEDSTVFTLEEADLSLIKDISASSSATPNIGDTVTFEITVTNDGPNIAENVVVMDLVPSGYTIGTINNGGTSGGNFITWDISSLPVGAGNAVTVSFDAIVNATGDYKNTAEILFSDQFDTDSEPGNEDGDQSEDDEDAFTVIPQRIDLELEVSVNNTTPNVGDTVTFTVDVTNQGPNPASGVNIENIVPVGYSTISAISNSGVATGNVINWSGLSLSVGGSTSLTFNAVVVAPIGTSDEYRDIAQVIAANQYDIDSTPNNDDGDQSEDEEDNVSVIPPISDLSLVKTADITNPNVGDTVLFTLTITNAGPSIATGVAVRDVVPTGFSLVTVNGGTATSNIANWTGLTIAANNGVQVVTYTANVNAPTGTVNEYLNKAEIVAADQFDPDSDVSTDDSVDEDGDGDGDDDDEDELEILPKQADLSLTKIVVDNDLTPIVGSEITFEVTVFNDGPSDATGVVVEDLLPSGYDFILFSSTSGTYNETTGVWTVGNVIAGGTQTLLVDVLVNGTGIYTNVAEVTASDVFDADSTPNNNILAEDDQDNAIVSPIQSTDLSVTNTVDNSTPDVNTNVTFTVTVANEGPSDATNVVVRNLLPSGYTYVSNDLGVSYNAVTGDWSVGTLASGTIEILNMEATVNTTGNYTSIAEVTASDQLDIDSTPNNDILAEDDQDDAVTIPRALVDVSVTNTASTLTPTVGQQIDFTITVTNDGPSDATTIVVTNLLPSGYDFVNATPSIGTYEPLNGSWTIGNLPTGITQTLVLTADVRITGTYTNTAELTDLEEFDIDSEPANNDDTEDDQATVNPIPVAQSDLSLEKLVDNNAPFVGETVEFTINLSNEGLNNATGVVVTDLLPSGYTFVSHTATVGDYNEATGIWSLNNIIFTNTIETLSIFATVNAAGNYTNVAEVTLSDNVDVDSTPNNGVLTEDDQDEVTTNPIALADLSIVQTVDNQFPDVSDTVIFTLTLTNEGPSDATNVVVSDVLETGYTYVSDDSGGIYNSTSGLWNVGNLLNGETVTLNITASINTSGSYINVAEVTGVAEQDPDSSPNNNVIAEDDQAEAVTYPRVITDISVLNTVDNLNPSVGDQIVFTITVTNDGPSDATGVIIEDIIASGYNFENAVASLGSYTEGIGSWDVGTLSNGSTETLDITVTVLPNGEYANIAELIALDTFDPDSSPDNNLNSEDDQDTVNPIPSGLADLSITNVVNNVEPNIGDIVEFTVNLTNSGDSDATGVEVTNLLPEGYTYASHVTTIGIYDEVSGLWSTNGTIPNGTTETLIILATVNTPQGLADEYLSEAEVTASNQTDPDSDSSSDINEDDYADGLEDDDEASAFVVPQVTDIAVTISVSNETPRIGKEVTFTIVAENVSAMLATNIGVENILPTGYRFISAQASNGFFDTVEGFWSIATLTAQSSETLEIVVEVLEPNDYINTVSLSYVDQIDINEANNRDQAFVTPSCLHVFNEFSPNGDGVNDVFKIECITRYPNNSLKIYNRWGNIVFEQNGYDNTWQGISNGRATVSTDEALPVGTYYYVLDLGEGSEPIQDWLYINR
ncbi:gliding motility-associated C-terminal domain-containing protein [uncultured Maribacter sp.]|uniref:PKD domain-containing protein n=1 Tax=uncultured Maribacter sp. TaxID=431308 RepID=UPI00262875F8|nr:gliding motility-associated C-terminal domain-containing protein [uncultured Maribacter sp.]